MNPETENQAAVLRSQLNVCEVQLHELELLISDDPSNENLAQLKNQLQGTIQILKDALASSIDKEQAGDQRQQYSQGRKQEKWQPGQLCYAPRLFDRRYAIAKVIKVDEDSRCCWVTWDQPRRRYEQACKWYQQGICRNKAEECKFSHGVQLDTMLLQPIDYSVEKEDLARASKVGAEVKVKYIDSLWYDAVVDAVTEDDSESKPFAMVHFDGFGEHEDHFKVPLSADNIALRDEASSLNRSIETERDNASDDIKELSVSNYSSSFYEEDSDSENDDKEFVPRQMDESLSQEVLHRASLNGLFQDAYVVGEWEQHTKGVGSKLMAKMGYIRGFGLGNDKKGIIRPISVRVLPSGVSLDFLDEVKVKETKEKQKRKKKRGRKDGSPEMKTDVFSLLNTKISGHHSSLNGESNSSHTKKHLSSRMKKEDLQRHMLSSRDEQVAVKKQIKKLEESLERNKDHAGFSSQILQQIQNAKQRLSHLQSKSIKAEEAFNEKRTKKKSKKSYF